MTMRNARLRGYVVAAVVATLVAPSAYGQATSTAGGKSRASRVELATRVTELETETQGSSLKGQQRVSSLAQLADLRARLADGDFKAGDRFAVTITMDSSSRDTISVRDGAMVSVASLPDLSLKGVLRSELDSALTAHVLRYFKNVRLRTTPLTQISIIGAVGRPGFYWTSPDRPLADLLMIAGGPLPDANLREIEVRRSNSFVLSKKESRKALSQGRTMEEIDVRSGDEVKIPQKRKINWQVFIQLLLVISTTFFALVTFIQWYYSRQE